MRPSPIVLALAISLLVPALARASADLYVSAGQGLYLRGWDTADALRGPVSVEVVPSIGWDLIKLDLGVWIPTEQLKDRDQTVVLRPGVRLTPGPIFIRAAAPIHLGTERVDSGVLLGLGARLKLGRTLGVFIEADGFPSSRDDFDSMPLEGRAGVLFAF